MDSTRCSGPHDKIPPAPGTNQIAGFVEYRLLPSQKKIKYVFLVLSISWSEVYFVGINFFSQVRLCLFSQIGQLLNPLTPGAFGQKCDFFGHFGGFETGSWPN